MIDEICNGGYLSLGGEMQGAEGNVRNFQAGRMTGDDSPKWSDVQPCGSGSGSGRELFSQGAASSTLFSPSDNLFGSGDSLDPSQVTSHSSMQTRKRKKRNSSFKGAFKCENCGNSFSYERNYKKHISLCDKGNCKFCKKNFRKVIDREKHERNCEAVTCMKCSHISLNLDDHNEHLRSHKNFTCRICFEAFTCRKELYKHKGLQHGDGNEGDDVSIWPWGENAPWINEEGEINEDLENVIKVNKGHILGAHVKGEISSVYNFPTNNLDIIPREYDLHLNEIHNQQSESYKINVSYGLILQNVETEEYRYFIPYRNSTLFDSPQRVNNHHQLNSLKEKMSDGDIENYFIKNRPNTKWKVVLITNVTYFVTKVGYLLGKGFLPDYIKNKMSVIGLDTDKSNNPIEDALCAFRCIALQKGQESSTVNALHYYHIFREHVLQNVSLRLPSNPKAFLGLDMELISELERCFSVSIYIYELQGDDSVILRYKPSTNFRSTMYLNVFENHLSYISKFSTYAKKFTCSLCNRLFSYLGVYKRHLKTCSLRTKFSYKGGFYSKAESIFEELEQNGIFIPEQDRLFEDFAVFDCESILEKVQGDETAKMKWERRHNAVSVSVCSSVDGYSLPKCFVQQELGDLVQNMVEYLGEIQRQSEENAREKWKEVFEQLEEMKEKWEVEDDDREVGDEINSRIREGEGNDNGRGDDVLESDEFDEEDECVEREGSQEDKHEDQSPELIKNTQWENKKLMYDYVKGLSKRFEQYVGELPVLGFNSARYDVNLLKMALLKILMKENKSGDEKQEPFVIKRNNSYIGICNGRFRFLDICQFLAPGVSYSKFLAAYKISEAKSYFCYEYLDSFERLRETALPPHEAFYSELKGSNISDEEYNSLVKVWNENKMSTLQDLLIFYNNLDVKPFVEGVKRLQSFYFERGIDIFKVAFSAPGIARKMLFDTAHSKQIGFSLIGQRDEDLYLTFKKNLVGGPAIVFCRHQKKGETFIRESNKKLCQKIVGYDANALYLWAISQPMPTGSYIRREYSSRFIPQKHSTYNLASLWLEMKSSEMEQNLICKYKMGKEKRIGPFYVDGYDPCTKTVYEFNGCYFHGCECMKGRMNEQDRIERSNRTKMRLEFIQSQGYETVIQKECEFTQKMKDNGNIKEIEGRIFPKFYLNNRHSVSESQIVQGILSGELFGAVEVDISVPDKWPKGKEQSTSPKEYFSEMCPIFSTVNVGISDIGEHMRSFILEKDLSTKDRKMLISEMKAEKILLFTPLIQWYLKHGMVITRIHQVVEFLPNACFKSFEETITSARRDGDLFPEQGIIADTMKLLGNSAYGGVIMQKEKHQKIKYVHSRGEAVMIANWQSFRKMEELGENFYEIELAKDKVTLDMPIYLGFSILQYAKLKMLEFYYDCLDFYVHREDFCYVTMDTDSAYLALSSESLMEVLKKEKREQFIQEIYHRCSDEKNPKWLIRECCVKHRTHDKRLPGIMKEEAEGEEIIALSSKTYILNRSLNDRQNCKFSCKGINKSRLQDPLSFYENVLVDKQPIDALNVGIRYRNCTMYSYKQKRTGFSYVYCKRKVKSDGVRTEPLGITLRPWECEQNRVIFQGQFHPLSNNYACKLYYSGKIFFSSEHLYHYRKCVFYGHLDLCHKIENCQSIHKVHEYSEKVNVCVDWESVRRKIMNDVLILKMRTNNEVRRQLFKSSSKKLVYANKKDIYWGVGMTEKVCQISTEDEYRGRNALGREWEDIREMYWGEIVIQGTDTPRCSECEIRRTDVVEGKCSFCFSAEGN